MNLKSNPAGAAYIAQRVPEQSEWQQGLEQLSGSTPLWESQLADTTERDSYLSQMSLLSSLGLNNHANTQAGSWPMPGQVRREPC